MRRPGQFKRLLARNSRPQEWSVVSCVIPARVDGTVDGPSQEVNKNPAIPLRMRVSKLWCARRDSNPCLSPVGFFLLRFMMLCTPKPLSVLDLLPFGIAGYHFLWCFITSFFICFCGPSAARSSSESSHTASILAAASACIPGNTCP